MRLQKVVFLGKRRHYARRGGFLDLYYFFAVFIKIDPCIVSPLGIVKFAKK